MASGSIVINHSPRVVISVQLEISFIETLIVLWWQRTCCSSDCGSRVVRKASEGNLETPTMEILIKWHHDFLGYWRVAWNIFDFTVISISFIIVVMYNYMCMCIYIAWFSLFVCITQDGWVDIRNELKNCGHSVVGEMYLIVFITIGAFILDNLVVVIVATKFVCVT